MSVKVTLHLSTAIALFVRDRSFPVHELLSASLFQSEENAVPLAEAIGGFDEMPDGVVGLSFPAVLRIMGGSGSGAVYPALVPVCWRSAIFCKDLRDFRGER
jgi:hypothetical protein